MKIQAMLTEILTFSMFFLADYTNNFQVMFASPLALARSPAREASLEVDRKSGTLVPVFNVQSCMGQSKLMRLLFVYNGPISLRAQESLQRA
jgi:hypothetical protein